MKLPRLKLWPAVFWIVLVFQVSILPDVLGVTVLARIANALVLILFFMCALSVLTRRMSERVAQFYVFPILLVILGYVLNIARSGHIDALSHLGLVLPWLGALSVPFMRGVSWERYWLSFYRFMVVVSVIALVEYAAVFENLLTPTLISTRYGEFLKGVFTIFHGLDDGVAYERMYGVFPEPGTYAMLLLPVMGYGLIHRRFLAVALFFTCLVFTGSLGGYLGLVVLLFTYAYWLGRTRSPAVGVAVVLAVLMVAALAGGAAYDIVKGMYDNRAGTESASLRESNVSLFFRNFSSLVFEMPLGMDLTGGTLSTLGNSSRLYIGSNFSIGTALILGGIASMLGYVSFLVVNIAWWLRGLGARWNDKNAASVYVGLPALATFIVQRTTIFEYAIYAFLFAAPVLASLRSNTPAFMTLPGLARQRL